MACVIHKDNPRYLAHQKGELKNKPAEKLVEKPKEVEKPKTK